jgi:hypothetical protein
MKQEIIINYADRKYLEEDDYMYNFNFLDRELTISKRGACSSC